MFEIIYLLHALLPQGLILNGRVAWRREHFADAVYSD